MSLLWRELDTRTDEWAESTAFEYCDKTFCPYSPFEVERKSNRFLFFVFRNFNRNGGILSKNDDILWRCVPVGYPHKHDLRSEQQWNKQPVLQLVHTPRMQPRRTTKIWYTQKQSIIRCKFSLWQRRSTQQSIAKVAKHISIFVESQALHFHDNRIHFRVNLHAFVLYSIFILNLQIYSLYVWAYFYIQAHYIISNAVKSLHTQNISVHSTRCTTECLILFTFAQKDELYCYISQCDG